MQKKEIEKWIDLTHKTLDATRQFRILCKKPFDRGFIGELLVLERLLKTHKSKLCASVNNGFFYAGSANKKWDISLKINNKTVYINAKATSAADKDGSPRFVRQQAKLFCDIEIDEGTLKQAVSARKDNDPNLFYVFVDVCTWLKNRKAKAIFYTLSDETAKSIFKEKYFKIYNKKIRKSKSTDFWIEYRDIKKYKDDNVSRVFKRA